MLLQQGARPSLLLATLQVHARALSSASLLWAAGPVLGAQLTVTKAFSPQEVAAFVCATGDANPIHSDPTAAAARGFPRPILPGMLMASLFPGLVGSACPGALYLTQTLRFKRHALLGDSVTATVTVTKASGSRLVFDTRCTGTEGGVLLLEGEALALLAAPQPGDSRGGSGPSTAGS